VETAGQVDFPIAWLPPGHDPGAGGGVATTALQRDRFGLDILERRRDLSVTRGFVSSDVTESEATDSQSSERGDSCRKERPQVNPAADAAAGATPAVRCPSQ
jgi:hypothetical protein